MQYQPYLPTDAEVGCWYQPQHTPVGGAAAVCTALDTTCFDEPIFVQPRLMEGGTTVATAEQRDGALLLPHTPTHLDNLHSPVCYEKERLLDEGYTVRRHDVICARQGVRDRCAYAGNERFRLVVAMRVTRYQLARTRLERMHIVKEIVDAVRQAGGGFVRHVAAHSTTTTNGGAAVWTPGRWIDIGNLKAREKAGHALRKYLGKKKSAAGLPLPPSLSSTSSTEEEVVGVGGSQSKAAKAAAQSQAKKPRTAGSTRKITALSGNLSVVSADTHDPVSTPKNQPQEPPPLPPPPPPEHEPVIPKLLLMPILSPATTSTTSATALVDVPGRAASLDGRRSSSGCELLLPPRSGSWGGRSNNHNSLASMLRQSSSFFTDGAFFPPALWKTSNFSVRSSTSSKQHQEQLQQLQQQPIDFTKSGGDTALAAILQRLEREGGGGEGDDAMDLEPFSLNESDLARTSAFMEFCGGGGPRRALKRRS